MVDVQFNEPTYRNISQQVTGPRGLVGLVIRAGLAKNDVEAQKVLLIVLVVAVLCIIGIFVFGNVSTKDAPLPPVPVVVHHISQHVA